MVIFTSLSGVLIAGLAEVENILGDRFAVSPEGKLLLAERCRRQFFQTYRTFRTLLRGQIDEDEYLKDFFRGEKYVFTPSDVKDAVRENLARPMLDTLKVYQRIIGHPIIIDQDHRDGLIEHIEGAPKIYLVSDFWQERIDEVKAAHQDIFKAIDKEFWSCNMRFVKQDENFFPYLLCKSKLTAGETILIDNSFRNITSASQHGIDGIIYSNPEQLETALSLRGFKFAPATN